MGRSGPGTPKPSTPRSLAPGVSTISSTPPPPKACAATLTGWSRLCPSTWGATDPVAALLQRMGDATGTHPELLSHRMELHRQFSDRITLNLQAMQAPGIAHQVLDTTQAQE